MPDYLFPAVCAAPNWLLHLGFSLGWVGSKTITMDHLFSSLSSHRPFGGIKKNRLIWSLSLSYTSGVYLGGIKKLLLWITFFPLSLSLSFTSALWWHKKNISCHLVTFTFLRHFHFPTLQFLALVWMETQFMITNHIYTSLSLSIPYNPKSELQ